MDWESQVNQNIRKEYLTSMKYSVQSCGDLKTRAYVKIKVLVVLNMLLYSDVYSLHTSNPYALFTAFSFSSSSAPSPPSCPSLKVPQALRKEAPANDIKRTVATKNIFSNFLSLIKFALQTHMNCLHMPALPRNP